MSDQQSHLKDSASARKNVVNNHEIDGDLREVPEAEYREGRSAPIIGMGLFGTSVVLETSKLGWFVRGDGEPEKLNSISTRLL